MEGSWGPGWAFRGSWRGLGSVLGVLRRFGEGLEGSWGRWDAFVRTVAGVAVGKWINDYKVNLIIDK